MAAGDGSIVSTLPLSCVNVSNLEANVSQAIGAGNQGVCVCGKLNKKKQQMHMCETKNKLNMNLLSAALWLPHHIIWLWLGEKIKNVWIPFYKFNK